MHADKDDVGEIILLGNNRAQYRKLMVMITNQGNYAHNLKVIERGIGELVVVKRPNLSTPAHKYLPCSYCYGFYHHRTLARHSRSCIWNKQGKTHKSSVTNGLFMLAQVSCSEQDIELVLNGMRETTANADLLPVIEKDQLILTFGKHQMQRLGITTDIRRQDLNNIRCKIRMIARLYIKLREKIPHMESFLDIITPSQYESFVEVVREMSVSSNQLGRSLSIYIKQLVLLKISITIQSRNTSCKKDAEDFKALYDATWTQRVTSAINKRYRLSKINKSIELPLDTDLHTFSEFLVAECLKESDINRLKKLVLASMLIFNKRRPMEIHDITTEDFLIAKQRQADPTDIELVESMSSQEQALAKRMLVLEVRGKSTRQIRRVHVLLTDVHVKYVEKIIASQESSKYIFSRPLSKTPMDGTNTLRQVVMWCQGLQYPERIHSRKLRQAIATKCQMLNMTDLEVKQLADHLGHDLAIHSDHYRLQSSLVERTKIAGMLIDLDSRSKEKHGSEKGESESREKDSLISLNTDGPAEETTSRVEVKYKTAAPKKLSARSRRCELRSKPSDDSEAESSETEDDQQDYENKVKRTRWTPEEISKFKSCWSPSSDKLPSRPVLDALRKLLPTRSLLVLRARANNMLKARKSNT